MNVRIVLAAIGLAYVALAVWCAVYPEQTSRSVGLQRSPGSGASEYLTVYGGLQLGLGLVFLLPLLHPATLSTVVLASVLIHLAIVAARLSSLVMYSGISRTTCLLAAVEAVILVVSALLLWHTGTGSTVA